MTLSNGTFSALLDLCEGNPPFTKTSDAELWCFLWSAHEETVEQPIETLVICDAIAIIMTSIWWVNTAKQIRVVIFRNVFPRSWTLFGLQKTFSAILKFMICEKQSFYTQKSNTTSLCCATKLTQRRGIHYSQAVVLLNKSDKMDKWLSWLRITCQTGLILGLRPTNGRQWLGANLNRICLVTCYLFVHCTNKQFWIWIWKLHNNDR